nr:hypothetical protein [Tanacetum cinerariifolium]
SGRIVPLFDTMLVHQGEGSGTPSEPHYTPFPKVETSHPTTSTIPLPSIPTAPIPPVTQPVTTPIIQYSRRARIAQSSALPTVADDPASPMRDAQEEEIVKLKDMVKVLEDREATVLAGVIDVPTGSGFIPTAGPPATVISTSSEVGPTASPIVTRRKGKEVMVESDTLKKKKLQEQIDAQVARELEEQQEKEDIRMNEQIARDTEEETERLKRKGLNLEKEQVKKQNSSEEAPEIETPTEEFTKEKIKEMMQLVLIEDVYVQALQVKHPIIDWKVHTEGQRSYWQIIRLGGSSACYQFFVDLLEQLDREDLNQLWALVKEYLSIRPATNDKVDPDLILT